MSFSVSHFDNTSPWKALAIFSLIVGTLVLASVSPAHAADRRYFGDVVIGSGETRPEVSTPMGNVIVDGSVEDDVETGMGDVIIRGDAGGDVKTVAGNVRVEGPVGGDVECGMGRVYVNDEVDGGVNVGHGDIILGPEARIEGAISPGSGKFNHHPDARFDEIGMMGMASSDSDEDADDEESGVLDFLGWILFTSGFVAVSVLCAVALPRPLSSSARSLGRSPGWSFLIGVVSFPAILVLSVVLAISVVGIPILLLLTPAYLALLLFGAFVAAYFLGRKVLLATGRYRGGDVLAAIVGALIICVSYLIPFLGGLLLTVFILLGTGAAILAIFSRRPRPNYGSYEEYVQDRRNP